MSLRLCVECGARTPRPPKPCGSCGAPASTWVPLPFTLGDEAQRRGLRRLGLSVAAAVLIAGLVVAVVVLGSASPLGRSTVLLQALLVLVAVFVGFFAVASFMEGAMELSERRYRHDDGERRGTARMGLGPLWEASGSVTGPGVVFAPGAPGLTAAVVLTHIRDLAPAVGRALQRDQPSAVDVAVTAALLGLASRGRCELVLRTTRSWEKTEHQAVRRHLPSHTLWLRRDARALGQPPEDGAVEAAILVALGQDGVAAAAEPGAKGGVYRRAPEVDGPPAGELISIEQMMLGLIGKRPYPRGWLRRKIRKQVRQEAHASPHAAPATGEPGQRRRRPPTSERRLGEEETAALARQLTALLSTGPDGIAAPSAALLRQVSAALWARRRYGR